MKRFLAALVLAASLETTALPASAQWWHGNPPPPRYERHPFRHGYTWESGHWAWRGGAWAWIPGFYVAIRPGGHWVPGHWRYGPRGRMWVPGHWR